MSTFDSYNWESFFFGALERDEANRLLASAPIGAFLLRESHSRPGGFSLSVKECLEGDHQIFHYFIEKTILENKKERFEICGNFFIDIPSLITHYQMHTLEKSCLVQPILKHKLCTVIGRYKFDGERVTDLPFERGEILEIIGKPEDSWWMARNSLNNTGLIPVPYYKDGDEISLLNPSTNTGDSSEESSKRFSTTSEPSISTTEMNSGNINGQTHSLFLKRLSQDIFLEEKKVDFDKSLDKISSITSNKVPAWVRVTTNRFPSIYDLEALILKEGQMIYLIEILPSGMCRGQSDVSGRIGLFPFSYVEWTNIPIQSGPWIPPEY